MIDIFIMIPIFLSIMVKITIQKRSIKSQSKSNGEKIMHLKRYNAERFKKAYNPVEQINYDNCYEKPNGIYIFYIYVVGTLEATYVLKYNGKLFFPDEYPSDWIKINP
jgi:hypothetical protein